MAKLLKVNNKAVGVSDGIVTVPEPNLISKTITANGDYSAADDNADGYSEVRVDVDNTPSKGFVPTEWDNDGYVTKGKFYGISQIPNFYFHKQSTGGFSEKLQNIDTDTPFVAIGQEAFYLCSNLEYIDISQITSAPDQVFRGCIKLNIPIPQKLISFGAWAFRSCESLVWDELNDNVTVLSDQCLADCKNLKLTKLPKNLITIGNNCLSSCKNTISAIPAKVNTIGSTALYGNNLITSLTFLGTPTSIANDSFQRCYNLTNIYCPWSEGEVANAPWGATNATIHYNYYTLSTYEADGTTITVTKNGAEVTDGEHIEANDVLTISVTGGTITVNGQPFTSGSTHTVSGSVIVESTVS